MIVKKYILDFDNTSWKASEAKGSKDGQLQQVLDNIKKECLSCHVNKPYQRVRQGIDLGEFQIEAKFKGEHIVLLKGNIADYHESLINDIALKFFYNINRSFTISPEAFDFIRRIPPEEWKILANIIDGLPDLTHDQIHAFKVGQWDHPIFQHNEWPAFALKAYFKGDIDRDRISTLLLYDTCRQTHPDSVAVVHLKEINGAINQASVDLLERILVQLFRGQSQQGGVKEEEKQSLLSRLDQLPPEDTQFFTYASNDFVLSNLPPDLPRFFIENSDGSKTYVIIPPKLMEGIYQAKFSGNAIKLNPVLGFSMRDDFSHKTKRDVLVPIRYVSSPNSVHDYNIEKEPVVAYLHDLVHGLIESTNFDRAYWLEIAAELEVRNLPLSTDIVLDRAFEDYLGQLFLGTVLEKGKLIDEVYATLAKRVYELCSVAEHPIHCEADQFFEFIFQKFSNINFLERSIHFYLKILLQKNDYQGALNWAKRFCSIPDISQQKVTDVAELISADDSLLAKRRDIAEEAISLIKDPLRKGRVLANMLDLCIEKMCDDGHLDQALAELTNNSLTLSDTQRSRLALKVFRFAFNGRKTNEMNAAESLITEFSDKVVAAIIKL